MVRRTGFLLLLFLPMALLAQSPRSAVGGEAGLWVAGEMSSFNPSLDCTSGSPFGCASEQLIGPTAVFDFNARTKWGAEGEARWLQWHGLGGMTQADYLIGPRYRILQHGRLNGWVKLELGGAWITTANFPAAGSLKGSYFVYAPGGTIDYHLTPRFSLRGDYEYQFWPSFQGPTTSGTTVSDITPNGFSVGVAYRFLGQ
jgi:opacity protein-like surface antigen